ncbi:hypothetical protein [Streptomyces sp. NPDC046985]|uniref:hypothetical protein n=1 Tax=Streptomyces sp. NPDC046985 TaxID=3155377 RepID=UPI0033F5746B
MSGGAYGLRGAASGVPPAERGATEVADRVVAKIAARAAREAVGLLPPGAAAPDAAVVVRAGSAVVEVRLDLPFPGDVGAWCARVRRHVVERVGALVGMRVPEVVIRVERLLPLPAHGAPPTAQGRVL